VHWNLSAAEQLWNRHDCQIEARSLRSETCRAEADCSPITVWHICDSNPSNEPADDPTIARDRSAGLRTCDSSAAHADERDEHRPRHSIHLYR